MCHYSEKPNGKTRRQFYPVIIVFLGTILQFGCHTTIRDIGSLEPYSKTIGSKYMLMQDCFLFSYSDTRSKVFIGNSSCAIYLPDKINEVFVGKRIGEVYIFGIVHKGAIFTVVGVEQNDSFETGTVREWKVIFDDHRFGEQVCYATDLTDILKNPPTFRENLARIVQQ
jgi:hypothetical protein